MCQGLNKDKDKSDKGPDSRVSNSFWVYSIAANRWTCYYKNENSSPDYWNMMQHLEPRPRYAHQLVYDDVNRVSKVLDYTGYLSQLRTMLPKGSSQPLPA